MPYTIYWDNGADACGTWGHLKFDTEAEADEYAESVTREYIAEGIWDEEGGAESFWVDPEPNPTPEEIDSLEEQSLGYFNRFIAGDR